MFDFQGKTSQKDFWSVLVADWLITVAFGSFHLYRLLSFAFSQGSFSALDSIDLQQEAAGLVVFSLLVKQCKYFLIWYVSRILPTIAMSVRRLHDAGKTGYLYFLNILLPGIGSLLLFYFYTLDSVKDRRGHTK